jgi:PPOX class probable F420-dependent enzyme
MDEFFELIASTSRGVLVTLKRDGRPQLSNVDYTYQPTSRLLRISTRDSLAKARNVRRDPRVSFYVTVPGMWAYAVGEGAAELSLTAADPHDATVEELVEVYRAIQGEHPDWNEYRAAMVTDSRLVLRVRLDRVYGWRPPGTVGPHSG